MSGSLNTTSLKVNNMRNFLAGFTTISRSSGLFVFQHHQFPDIEAVKAAYKAAGRFDWPIQVNSIVPLSDEDAEVFNRTKPNF
jgi:hypothetical protein